MDEELPGIDEPADTSLEEDIVDELDNDTGEDTDG